MSIPCYNDSSSLIELHKHFTDFVAANQDLRISFLFIDDGSTDNTRAVLNEIRKKTLRCEIVFHEKNLGFGPTFKEALTIPQTEYVFFIPADGQFPVKNLKQLVDVIEKNDLVLGVRKLRKDNMYRRFISMIYNRTVSLIASAEIRDVNSIVLFRSEIFQRVSLNSRTAFVNAEFVLKALKSNFRFHQVEIDHNPRIHGAGSGGKVSVIVPACLDLVKYLLRS